MNKLLPILLVAVLSGCSSGPKEYSCSLIGEEDYGTYVKITNSEIIIDGNHNELANNLKNAVKNSLKGLTNLKTTYINDSITIAKLTLIINRLNKVIDNLENIENNISMTILNNIESNVNNN